MSGRLRAGWLPGKGGKAGEEESRSTSALPQPPVTAAPPPRPAGRPAQAEPLTCRCPSHFLLLPPQPPAAGLGLQPAPQLQAVRPRASYATSLCALSPPPQEEASNTSGCRALRKCPCPPSASRARGHTVGAQKWRPPPPLQGKAVSGVPDGALVLRRGPRHSGSTRSLAGRGSAPSGARTLKPAPASARPCGRGRNGAGPSPLGPRAEGWSLGFCFLQTPGRQGNRGVSGNRAGSAEVHATAGGRGRAGVQCRGPVALWKFQQELGKTGPGKAPPECSCPH